MKDTILMVSLVVFINFYSSDVIANAADLSSAVKDYTFKDGEPYGLSQVYQVNAPDVGFPPYYIFLKLGIEHAYPFVFNREGVPGKDEPYSRCNVVLAINGQYFIPERTYKSGYAEDSEPCIGVEKIRMVKGSRDIKWYVIDALYYLEGYVPEKNEEVYFYSDGDFCFSQTLSSKFATGKVSMEDLKVTSLDNSDFKQCAK